MKLAKAIHLILILLISVQLSAQKAWTVESVPNTRLESNLIHVSNPDGILSDSCEQLINTSLDAIRDQADVFVVALESIGDADIEVFANELFNYWGIGDRDKDNGVLILLAKEQRELKFETGYGVESILTDARCQKIFVEDIVPFFKEGDYQSGLCSGVTRIVKQFGGEVPDGLVTILPSQRGASDNDDVPVAEVLLGLLLFGLPFLSGLVYLFHDVKQSKKASSAMKSTVVNGVRYFNGDVSSWDGNPWLGVGCLKAILFGISPFIVFFICMFIDNYVLGDADSSHPWRILLMTVVVYLTWVCLRQNIRALRVAKKKAAESLFPQEVYLQASNNSLTKLTRYMAVWVGWVFHLIFKKRIEKTPGSLCAECHTEMHAFNRYPFSALQMKEQELKTVSYKPYICQYGHVSILKKTLNAGFRYGVCPACHGRTDKMMGAKTITMADYSQPGLKEVTYHCEFCGATRIVKEVIPKLVHYSSGSSYTGSSSSRSHHYSSHSHSGGSFGGGRSGGGGYKGSW